MLQAIDIYGNKHEVGKSALIFRPTVYGIFIKDNKTLVLETRSTGKFQLGGGGIDPGESLEVGLRREIKEELGLKINIDKFLYFSEGIFFNRPEAWDCFRYFYLCSSNEYSFLSNDEIQDDEAMNPQWIDIHKLNKSTFNYSQLEILPILHKLV